MGGRRVLRGMLGRLLLCAALAATSAGFFSPSRAYAYDSDLGAGTVHALTYKWSFPATRNGGATSGSNAYLLYTPAGWTASDRLPLYVLLHGCSETVDKRMMSARMNPVADSQRFLVLYPDDQTGGGCFHAASPPRNGTVRDGGGDASIIAGMTRAVMSGYNVDSERVYILGLSAGADQASATAFAYPDLYAAAGVNSGGGPNMQTTCPGAPDAVVPFYAESTFEQMGTRARVVPFFAISGDADPLSGQGDYESWVSPNPTGVHPKVAGCTRLAYQEVLDIDHLVDPATPYATSYTQTGTVSAAQDGTPVQGHPWEREVALDGHGCEVAENWNVHGMGHAWSGGSTDPNAQGTDPLGPSTDENSWAFFRQFTLHGGNTTCGPQVAPAPSPANGNPPRPYSASASATLLTSDALNVAGQAAPTHLEVAPVSATVDSSRKAGSTRSLADARNLTMNVPPAGLNPDLLVEAKQSAAPSNAAPVHQESTAVPLAPVFNADLATADASARWANRSCISDGLIASAQSTLVNAQLEPNGANDGGVNWSGNAAGMDDYISPPGTATSTSTIGLTRHDTDGRYSLDATATTQISAINVSDALYVEVTSAPKAEVIATGVPGTAKVLVHQPVLRVEGMTLASGRTFTTTVSAGPVIEITPGIVSSHVSADGTTVSASGTLAHIKVVDATGTATALDATVGTLDVAANVPAGGVGCSPSTGSATSDTTITASSPTPGSLATATHNGVSQGAAKPAKSIRMSLVARLSALADRRNTFGAAVAVAIMTAALLRSRRRRRNLGPPLDVVD